MRKVGMLTQPDVKPYADARLKLQTFRSTDLAPVQTYVLADELLKVRELRWELAAWGVNLFHLDGYVSIKTDESGEDWIDVLPVIVEMWDGKNRLYPAPILNDGMHRAYLAMMEGELPQCVMVEGIPEDLPYYAFPLPSGWRDVRLVNEIPDGFIKKYHVIRDYKSLYRNFNLGFNNVGGPRGNTSKPVDVEAERAKIETQLKAVPTNFLVNELTLRLGVEEIWVEPHTIKTVDVVGQARVLVVTD